MRSFIRFIAAMGLLLPALAHANATPQEIVEDTSNRVMAVLDANRETGPYSRARDGHESLIEV